MGRKLQIPNCFSVGTFTLAILLEPILLATVRAFVCGLRWRSAHSALSQGGNSGPNIQHRSILGISDWRASLNAVQRRAQQLGGSKGSCSSTASAVP